MSVSQQLAKDLLSIKAVQINSTEYFTWTSGIKSPIYCDNRLTMSYPNIRNKIMRAFKEKVNMLEEKPDVIAGCATAGIPHAAWLADELNLPMIYVRSKPKGHGKGNQIEGKMNEGEKVLLIEDLISTGGSSVEAAKALHSEGAKVISVMAIFTYGLKKSIDNFKKSGFVFDTLTNFDDVLESLEMDGEITKETQVDLLNWRSQI